MGCISSYSLTIFTFPVPGRPTNSDNRQGPTVITVGAGDARIIFSGLSYLF